MLTGEHSPALSPPSKRHHRHFAVAQVASVLFDPVLKD